MEPMRHRAFTLAPDPKRAKLRIDNELPKEAQSITDALALSVTRPVTDTEEPHRAKLRTDNELPNCTKSNTDAAEPQRTNERTDNELPK